MIIVSQMVASTKTLKVMSAAVFQNRKKLMFKEVEFPYFDDVQ